MKHSAIHRALVAGAASVLLLSGCSEETTTDEGSDLTYGDSPLSEYMSTIWDAGSDPAAQAAAEEKVAQCMAEQGFEYAVPKAGSDGAPGFDIDPDEMNSREWIAKNGFGAADVYAEPEDAPVDLNAEYVESLSEASLAEYYAALYGEYGEGMTAEELESYVPSPEEQGCYGVSIEEDAVSEVYSDPAYQALFDGMMKISEDVQEDPAVVAKTAEWAECMADAGVTGVASQQELLDGIYAEFEEVHGWADGSVPGEDFEPDPEVLSELREREITSALADFDCRQETGYDDAHITATHAAEERFIADHKSELDAMIAQYGS